MRRPGFEVCIGERMTNFRVILSLLVVGFVAFCGVLVVESGLFDYSSPAGPPLILLQQTARQDQPDGGDSSGEDSEGLEAAVPVEFRATGGPEKMVILGAADPSTEDHETGFKFQLELDSKGAGIRRAIFSNGFHDAKPSGFNNRDPKNPQPLTILSAVPRPDDRDILSMANRQFVLVEQGFQFPLDKLSWKCSDVEPGENGSQTRRFEAVIEQGSAGSFLRVTKTYTVTPGSYLLDCSVKVENLSGSEQKIRFNLNGPVGIGREGVRGDMRKVVAGFRESEDVVGSTRLNIGKLRKADSAADRRLKDSRPGADLLWVATVNKYFAAIVVPVPDEGKAACDWVQDRIGNYYNPDGDKRADSGDETVGLDLHTAAVKLTAAGEVGSTKTYRCHLYLGPKDKSLFDKNELYRSLGFVQTIDFMSCCCPSSIINPLAFGILAVMKWMYGFLGNYGVVIIILVLLFRIIIHPLTKKSQVSMSKFSKLAPKAEEIKKKYANNKSEQSKQLMQLYRKQGASPVMGMLPMMVQMPVWIALYSAIYASIELRGAPFLPFWITDLSAPDALIRFRAVMLPLFGRLDSLNLLPILMGLAFYLQQKLMPSQAAASTNPQMAQQQKMMMIMLPILFPLMLYKAPSGLNLYIMASVSGGVVEQHIIRKHIRKKEDEESKGLVPATSKTGGKTKKKKPKPFYKF